MYVSIRSLECSEHVSEAFENGISQLEKWCSVHEVNLVCGLYWWTELGEGSHS